MSLSVSATSGRLVQEAVAVKAEAGKPLFDPKREEETLRRVAGENEGSIYDSSMREMFELSLTHSRPRNATRRVSK